MSPALRVARDAAERVLAAARAAARAPLGPSLAQLAPLALPLSVGPWLYVIVGNYREANVFRDTNLFNYVAWCMRHGERLYDTIATPDGPFIYVWQALVQLVAGTTEQLFRKWDLWAEIALAGGMGALLVPRAEERNILRRLVWAGVAAGVWVTVELTFGFAATAQREDYYAGFGSLGVCAVYASCERRPAIARWMLLAGGLLSGWMVFGKQTGVIYCGTAVLTALALPGDPDQRTRWRLGWVIAGLGSALATTMLFMATRGSFHGYVQWHFRYALGVYRYIDAAGPLLPLSNGDRRVYLIPAAVALGAGLASIGAGLLPRRLVGLAVMPALHASAALAQMKFYPYHFAPALLTAYLFGVAALASVWPSRSIAGAEDRGQAGVAAALVGALAWSLVTMIQDSPWLHESERHLDDGKIKDAHEAAKFLRAHTDADERVFYYGNDPAVVFLAERLPATPYEVSWLVNFDPALRNTGDYGPNQAQKDAILKMQSAAKADACHRLTKGHPAALVFMDHGDDSGADGLADVEGFCDEMKAFVDDGYRLAHTDGDIRIFLRNDHP